MELHVIRMVTDAAQLGTYGINAQLAALTRDGGDAAIASVATFLDETRDARIARNIIPDLANNQFPFVQVALAADADLEGESLTNFQDGEVNVALTYVTRDADSKLGALACFYTMIAIRRFLHDWLDNVNDVDRMRGGIEVVECTKMRMVRSDSELSDTLHIAHLIATLSIRDNNP